MTDYTLLKLLHLGALIFWLGPPLGAWLVLRAVETPGNFENPLAAKVSHIFFVSIVLEHLAFVCLLASGYMLAERYALFSAPWLQHKLLLIAVIILPMEIIDIILGNGLAASAAKRGYRGETLTLRQQRWLHIYRGPFTKLALVVIPPTVLAIMYLAIGKTAFF